MSGFLFFWRRRWHVPRETWLRLDGAGSAQFGCRAVEAQAMAVRIEGHTGVAKLHPGRCLDQGEPARLPLRRLAIDGGIIGEGEGQLHGPGRLGHGGFDRGAGPECQLGARFEHEHGKGGGLFHRWAAEQLAVEERTAGRVGNIEDGELGD